MELKAGDYIKCCDHEQELYCSHIVTRVESSGSIYGKSIKKKKREAEYYINQVDSGFYRTWTTIEKIFYAP